VTNASRDTYQLFGLTRSWNEKQVTWQQAAKGTNWSSAGADRTSASIGTVTATSKGFVTISLNATGLALVQSWINNPSSNNGITLQNYSASSDILSIASREAKTVNQRPKLNIAYTV
jgi:hypothetical protein